MRNVTGTDRNTGKEVDYMDDPVRLALEKIYKDIFGEEIKSNPEKYAIDLYFVNYPKSGVEAERGGHIGDWWEQDPYSFNKGTLPFPTVNMPYRKEHRFHLDLEWLNDYGNIKTSHTPGFEKNVFIRTNTDFTQINLVTSKTIRDPKKVHRSFFETRLGVKGGEHWLCFKREDVQTYNLINGVWVLSM